MRFEFLLILCNAVVAFSPLSRSQSLQTTPETATTLDIATPPTLFTEEQLIACTKEIISEEIKFGVSDDGEYLAENFRFIGAAVGPLNRKNYLKTTRSALEMLGATFEFREEFFGFHGDPEYPNCIWFIVGNAQSTWENYLGPKRPGRHWCCHRKPCTLILTKI